MIGTVLKEIEDSAVAQLPSRIDAVSSIRSSELGGESLVSSFTPYDWWAVKTGQLVTDFPALTIEWLDPSIIGQRNGVKARKGQHRIRAVYGVRHNDAAYIRRQILFVPEAMLLWLDELPTASRVPGKTITGLDKADDSEIEIQHDVQSPTGGFFIWNVAVDFTVLATDQNLPDRTI